jgi:hypothetical protein
VAGTFQDMFDSYALGSAEHQEHAQEVVGDKPFEADLQRGTVTFGSELTVRAELIGTEATGPGSWLWSWANPGGFGDHLTAAARNARGIGEREGIAELTTGELPLQGAVGYRTTVVTCGLAGGYAFYPATAAPGTTAYLLLDHPALAFPPVRLSRTVTVITALVASGQVADWRRALHTYAGQRGLEARPDERGVELVHHGGQGSVRVEIDQLGRVADIAGSLQAEPAPQKKGLFGRRR